MPDATNNLTDWKLSLQTQLLAPSLPAAADFAGRVIFLRHKLYWYELLDFGATFAGFCFFCYGIAFSIRSLELPGLRQPDSSRELARQEVFFCGHISLVVAVIFTLVKIVNEAAPQLKISENSGPGLFVVGAAILISSFIAIKRRYIAYVGI